MEDARRLFETSGAIRSGHFRFTGENHGDIYISKELLLSFPAKTQHVTALLAERCNNLLEDSIDVVVAPVDGGIIIGHSVALHLNRKTFFVFAKKGNDKFWFPAGFREKLKGKNVLIIDDVLHTGLSITRLVEVTRAAGANVLGVGVLWNRGEQTAETLGVPALISLIEEKFPSFTPSDCYLCKQGVSLDIDFGHGGE